MRWLKRIVIVLVMLLIIYLLGPKPTPPVYNKDLPNVSTLDSLEAYVAKEESLHRIKPGNAATIVWAGDSGRHQTEYAIVYLHGFSASQAEGDPVHRNIARRFGCNLYLSRLAEHGIDTTEQLVNLTADKYWESAKRALVIGSRLGKKVILMGTSTGGTQALQLAANYPSLVSGIILYSPNIAINDPNAWLLNNPWGLQIARLVKGGKYHDPADERPEYRRYWNKPYRLEAIVALEEMLETTMNPALFKKISQPVLMLYYYQNEAHQDQVVKVGAMKDMFASLATSAKFKREKAMPMAGDHVLASPIKSHDIQGVEKETASFLQEVIGLRPVGDSLK